MNLTKESQWTTRLLQSFYYRKTIRSGDPQPIPGSPRWVRDNRRIHMTIIVAYLLYTIYDADDIMQRQGDFYHSLGLPHNAEERVIKSRFRKLYVTHVLTLLQDTSSHLYPGQQCIIQIRLHHPEEEMRTFFI